MSRFFYKSVLNSITLFIQRFRSCKRYWIFSSAVLLTGVLAVGPGAIIRAGQNAINKMVILTMVLEKIERFYVQEKNSNELVEKAIQGMVANLDAHSSYLSAEEFSVWKRSTQGFWGIGLTFQKLPDRLLVTSIYPNSPAMEAGMQVGDMIIRVEGKKVEFLALDDINKLLQMDDRQTVKLQFERGGRTTLAAELSKRAVAPPSITATFVLYDSTGYVRIDHFTETTPLELDQAMQGLQQSGVRQLLLDLRNNPGGVFTSAVQIADRFLTSGKLIVTTRGRTPESFSQHTSTSGRKYPPWPLIVLIDEGSASDSEILAGALQDWDRGLLVGRPTFGKGSVQTEYSFQDGSGLLLTTAIYFTPLGRSLHHETTETTAKEFRTPMGRTVYGQGGLLPDIQQDVEPEVMTESLKKVLTAADSPLPAFIENQISGINRSDMTTFCRHHQIADATIQAFYDHARHAGFAFSNRDRQANLAPLRYILKREIAGRIWGEKGRALVTVLADKQIHKSTSNFNQARALAR
jgi:carboxyl-terminal processing protease